MGFCNIPLSVVYYCHILRRACPCEFICIHMNSQWARAPRGGRPQQRGAPHPLLPFYWPGHRPARSAAGGGLGSAGQRGHPQALSQKNTSPPLFVNADAFARRTRMLSPGAPSPTPPSQTTGNPGNAPAPRPPPHDTALPIFSPKTEKERLLSTCLLQSISKACAGADHLKSSQRCR